VDLDLKGKNAIVTGSVSHASPGASSRPHVELLGCASAAEMIHFHCVPLATRRLSSRQAISRA
jgi:hypothetical protein